MQSCFSAVPVAIALLCKNSKSFLEAGALHPSLLLFPGETPLLLDTEVSAAQLSSESREL